MNKSKTSAKNISKATVYRIIAIILALLFVGGIVVAAIPLFGDETPLDLSLLDSDTYIRVGMSYGKDVYNTFNLTSPDGFSIGIPSDGQDIIRITDTRSGGVMAALDECYYKKNGSYFLSDASGRERSIGGYHLVSVNMFRTYEEALAGYRSIYPYIDEHNLFFGYIADTYMLFVDSFFTYADAQAALEGFGLKDRFFIMSPNPSLVRVVDTDTELDLFITDTALCLLPAGTGDKAYIQTPSGYRYEGRFEFTRYSDGGVLGLRLVNTVDLESYVYGVVPWEISASSPIEALKAQAILARTYAMQSIDRHSAYGFDVCKQQHCQVYLGISLGNANVLAAVSGTAGQVVTYEDALAKVYYSSISGGSTVSSYDAWGGLYVPYLIGMATEWEKYEDYSDGAWTTVLTGTRLCEMLQNKGYNVSGRITDVEILEFAENSEYVKSIRFTDENGKQISIYYSDNIRSALSAELRSACFTVEKQGMQEPEYIEHIVPAQVLTGRGTATMPGNKNLIVATGVGILSLRADDSHTVLTAGGRESFSLYGEYSFNDRADEENERMRLEYDASEAVFVFRGKGFGHGVGMSQLGAKNLADAGKSCAEIIAAYFPGTEIKDKDGIAER